MHKSALVLAFVQVMLPLALFAQTGPAAAVQKTIEISATEKVEVPAETAILKIGYQNQAASKNAAYAESTGTANRILQALLDAGVPKDAIETESLSLARDEDRFGSKPQQPSTFTATQQWQIQSKAGEAQKIVDIAVAAGAGSGSRKRRQFQVFDERSSLGVTQYARDGSKSVAGDLRGEGNLWRLSLHSHPS